MSDVKLFIIFGGKGKAYFLHFQIFGRFFAIYILLFR